MGTLTDIEVALQSKLASITSPPYINWENDMEYKPTIGTRFWRPTHLPAHSVLANANAMQKHSGIFQVDVFVPIGKGMKVLLQDLDTIYSAYNSVTSLTAGTTRVDILGVGRGTVVKEQTWTRGYIQINYMCYAY